MHILASLSARRAWIEIEDWLNAGSLSRVALRKESVDRNGCNSLFAGGLFGSLSARRAWIEIWARHTDAPRKWVALRKESVDRNRMERSVPFTISWSLSARRAWIEIPVTACCAYLPMSRSPQGERG